MTSLLLFFYCCLYFVYWSEELVFVTFSLNVTFVLVYG